MKGIWYWLLIISSGVESFSEAAGTTGSSCRLRIQRIQCNFNPALLNNITCSVEQSLGDDDGGSFSFEVFHRENQPLNNIIVRDFQEIVLHIS